MLNKVSSFYVRRICLRKLLFQLYKEMKKNVKQKAVKRQSVRVPLEMCIEINVYSFIHKNKL